MVGLIDNKIQTTELSKVINCHKGADLEMYKLAQTLEFGHAKFLKSELPTLDVDTKWPKF